MGIRDRGLIKWRAASFLADKASQLRKVEGGKNVGKPILDELQWDEIEQNILLAMKFADYVRVEVWHGGFFKDHYGMIHRVDEINRTLYLETKDGKMIKICFSDIIGAFAENT